MKKFGRPVFDHMNLRSWGVARRDYNVHGFSYCTVSYNGSKITEITAARHDGEDIWIDCDKLYTEPTFLGIPPKMRVMFDFKKRKRR